MRAPSPRRRPSRRRRDGRVRCRTGFEHLASGIGSGLPLDELTAEVLRQRADDLAHDPGVAERLAVMQREIQASAGRGPGPTPSSAPRAAEPPVRISPGGALPHLARRGAAGGETLVVTALLRGAAAYVTARGRRVAREVIRARHACRIDPRRQPAGASVSYACIGRVPANRPSHDRRATRPRLGPAPRSTQAPPSPVRDKRRRRVPLSVDERCLVPSAILIVVREPPRPATRDASAGRAAMPAVLSTRWPTGAGNTCTAGCFCQRWTSAATRYVSRAPSRQASSGRRSPAKAASCR
jgi:hypothetical protein